MSFEYLLRILKSSKLYYKFYILQISSKDPEPWVSKEWQETQSMARKPVKITLPGPMTIIGSTASRFIPCQSAIVESSITKINVYLFSQMSTFIKQIAYLMV